MRYTSSIISIPPFIYINSVMHGNSIILFLSAQLISLALTPTVTYNEIEIPLTHDDLRNYDDNTGA